MDYHLELEFKSVRWVISTKQRIYFGLSLRYRYFSHQKLVLKRKRLRWTNFDFHFSLKRTANEVRKDGNFYLSPRHVSYDLWMRWVNHSFDDDISNGRLNFTNTWAAAARQFPGRKFLLQTPDRV